MQAFGSEGALGEPIFPPSLGFEPWCLEVGIPNSGGTYPWCAIPFAPHENTALTPNLDWVVGTIDTYAFRVHHPDGRLTRVSRHWEPVRLSAEEADYHRRRTTADLRQRDPGWTWSGPAIPEHKPAYTRPTVAGGSGGCAKVRRDDRLVIAPTTSPTRMRFAAIIAPAG